MKKDNFTSNVNTHQEQEITVVTIWESDKPAYAAHAYFFDKDTIELIDKEVLGSALVYAQINGRSYNFGEYFFNSGIGKKISLSSAEEHSLGKVGKKIEVSALNRFKGLLQRSSNFEIEIKKENLSYSGQIIPLTNGNTGSFFICQAHDVQLEVGEDITIAAYFGGIAYMFHTHVMDIQDHQFALSLPSAATRIIRRVVPRKAGDFICEILGSKQKIILQNYSAFGMCLQLEDLKDFRIGQEIQLTIQNSKAETCETYALIRDINADRLHIVFAGSTENMKKRFLMLGFEQFKPFEFIEAPEKSWECLDKYNYLSLLEPGVLELIHQKCVQSWTQLMNSDLGFQPVAFDKDEPIGTIGVVKMTDDLWLPHTLATKVDPSVIDVTAGLYSSWPNYLLSLSKPLWMVTWYNPNKSWHNRFYQVFIKEHAKDYNLVNFLRQLYLLPNIKEFPRNMYEFKENINSKDIEDKWNKIWNSTLASPVMHLKNECSEVIEICCGSIHKNDEVVGAYKLINSQLTVNPVSLFQAIYICIFEDEIRKSQKELELLMHTCQNFLKNKNFSRACITLDYDSILEAPSELGMLYVSELECLSATSKLLPSLIANNEISFADMKLRKIAS